MFNNNTNDEYNIEGMIMIDNNDFGDGNNVNLEDIGKAESERDDIIEQDHIILEEPASLP